MRPSIDASMTRLGGPPAGNAGASCVRGSRALSQAHARAARRWSTEPHRQPRAATPRVSATAPRPSRWRGRRHCSWRARRRQRIAHDLALRACQAQRARGAASARRPAHRRSIRRRRRARHGRITISQDLGAGKKLRGAAQCGSCAVTSTLSFEPKGNSQWRSAPTSSRTETTSRSTGRSSRSSSSSTSSPARAARSCARSCAGPSDGNVIDRTFRAGEKFRSVRTEARKMQFLYADGTDAHFMDTESFEQIAVAESDGRATRCAGPSRAARSTCCSSTISPRDLQLPSAVDLEVTADRPGPARRHGLGRRHQAGDARDRRGDPGAAVRRAGPAHPRGHALGRIRLRAPEDAPLRAAPGRGVRALPARPDRPAAGGDVRGRTTRCSCARWRTRRPTARQELDEIIDRHAHGWSVERIQPLERSIMRVALIEMLHPDAAPARAADPAGGRDRGGGRERQDVLRRGGAGLRQRGAGRSAARGARECAASHEQRPSTWTT